MPRCPHVGVATLIGLVACHSFSTNHLQHRAVPYPPSDDDEVSLLQTSSKPNVSHRQPQPGRPWYDLNGQPLDTELTVFDPIYEAPIEDLPQCCRTPGGGCEGGFDAGATRGTDTIAIYGVAPPHHFPSHSGCQWTSPKRIALIHVGKCAGDSLERMLQQSPVNFTHVHQNWAEAYFNPNDYDLFVVSTRDPVDRLVSAFNWRHPDMSPFPVGGPVSNWVPAEWDMYQCFMQYPGAMNAWAEALSHDTVCGDLARRCLHSPSARCAHLARGFSWYFQTGLNRFSDSLQKAVAMSGGQKQLLTVASENFSAGAAEMYDWLCVPPADRAALPTSHSNYPRHNDTELSSQGRQNLEDHTVDEYFALRQLSMIASVVPEIGGGS